MNIRNFIQGWWNKEHDWKVLIVDEHGRNECLLWVLINGVLCQIPLVFMWVNNISSSAIFSSGLSYLFTLYVASLYMLISIREENLSIYDLKNRRHIVSLILIIITFGFLCIYPDIKQKLVRIILVEHAFVSYVIIMLISLISAFLISGPFIIGKINDNKRRAKTDKTMADAKETAASFDDYMAQVKDEEDSFE